MSLGPFDLNGSQFLQLYLMLSVACVLFSLIIPALMRPAGRERRVDDNDQLALLSGGPTRLAEAAIARMMRTGAASINHRTIIAPRAREAATRPIDAALYDVLPAGWSAVQRGAKAHYGQIMARLTADGLMMDNETKGRIRVFQTLPLILLFLFGSTKLMIGVERDKPVGFLAILLIVTLVVGVVRWFVIDTRTEAGKRAVADMRRTEDRIRRAPTEAETERAVALFGTSVLLASPLASLHDLRRSGTGDSSSSNVSGCASGGSSGGGGGGCGGCGGD